MKIVAFTLVAFVALAGASCPYAAPAVAPAAAPGYPAPPCPTNYLFSCQPNLAPVPCAQQAPAYGSAGAYTEQVPRYVENPSREQLQRFHQRVGMAALMEELRGLGQGIQGQQY
ncbi:vitelline membrane protein Vm32E [Drosophila erecta]|uniref:Vitelline membrane protein Vm32E n=1 Tax=Drosophila erecta TaxID=7220 RepID=VTU4_DROER|nr:vitelline membrane protein Vm32E [Drosophila erecta]B3N4J9.1 RecName: Full=Vitelline membrane protein Vm32E; Flags: Precursor [Drosophila erecta]EDV58911.1 uncharacterized protein Dere_GG10317 [Drosophila erecta]